MSYASPRPSAAAYRTANQYVGLEGWIKRRWHAAHDRCEEMADLLRVPDGPAGRIIPLLLPVVGTTMMSVVPVLVLCSVGDYVAVFFGVVHWCVSMMMAGMMLRALFMGREFENPEHAATALGACQTFYHTTFMIFLIAGPPRKAGVAERMAWHGPCMLADGVLQWLGIVVITYWTRHIIAALAFVHDVSRAVGLLKNRRLD